VQLLLDIVEQGVRSLHHFTVWDAGTQKPFSGGQSELAGLRQPAGVAQINCQIETRLGSRAMVAGKVVKPNRFPIVRQGTLEVADGLADMPIRGSRSCSGISAIATPWTVSCAGRRSSTTSAPRCTGVGRIINAARSGARGT
jgi:hypothetical protein